MFVSFSGGKDSTVLAHLVHEFHPDVPLVFFNTGMEFPEIQAFARKMGATIIRPKMMFTDVLGKYGYPLISKEVSGAIKYARRALGKWDSDVTTMNKRKELMGQTGSRWFDKPKWLPLCRDTQFRIDDYCCEIMKKQVSHTYASETKMKPFVGVTTAESKLREQAWIRHGCNSFSKRDQISWPIAFWLEQDILKYICWEELEVAEVYGKLMAEDTWGWFEPAPGTDCPMKFDGYQRTGCMYCAYGANFEKKTEKSRFQLMAETHPRQYEYCIGGGQWVDNPDYDPVMPKFDGDWENWNPKKIWVPSKEGLGMKYVFDECNRLYGKDFIRYE